MRPLPDLPPVRPAQNPKPVFRLSYFAARIRLKVASPEDGATRHPPMSLFEQNTDRGFSVVGHQRSSCLLSAPLSRIWFRWAALIRPLPNLPPVGRFPRRERERKEAPLAIRATRPHTVGYIGGSDQEKGVIQWPCSWMDAETCPSVNSACLSINGIFFCIIGEGIHVSGSSPTRTAVWPATPEK